MVHIVPYFRAHGHGRIPDGRDARLLQQRERNRQRRDADNEDEQEARLQVSVKPGHLDWTGLIKIAVYSQ